jgi:isovaleryl-CoA dehydrogenase
MSESESGSDVMSMRLHAGPRATVRAERQQDVDHQRADRRHAGRVCDRRARAGTKGVTAFIVEKGRKGFSTAQKLDKLGMRGSDTCELVFEECEIPAATCWARSGRAPACS